MSVRKFELKAFQDLAFPVRVGRGDADGDVSTAGRFSANLKKVTVIVNGSDICMKSINAGLKELKMKGCYVTAVFTKAAEALVDMESFKREVMPDRIVTEPYHEGAKSLITNTDLCIAPNLTQNTLTKTALGIQDELSSMLLWQFLLNGVETVISTDSIYHGWFEADLNSTMKRVLEGYVKTLVSYGAKIEENFDYARYAGVEAPKPVVKQTKELDLDLKNTRRPAARDNTRERYPSLVLNKRNEGSSTGMKVITESYVTGCGASEIVLEKGQIVTPLAIDAAKSLGIRIVRS